MTARRALYVSPSRQAAISQADAARGWRLLIDLACVHAATVTRGADPDPTDLKALRGLAIQTERIPFPLKHHTATVAAEVFPRIVRGFADAGTPEDRAALADLMIEAGRCLDRLFINDAQRALYRATGERS